jgi:hypothetical protein
MTNNKLYCKIRFNERFPLNRNELDNHIKASKTVYYINFITEQTQTLVAINSVAMSANFNVKLIRQIAISR